MADIIQTRRDTFTNWNATDPILANGEQGYETDTQRTKFGDGVSVWTALPYTSGGGGGITKGAPFVVGDIMQVNSGVGDGVAESAGVAVSDLATSVQGGKADSATQPGDNVSTLTNDAGYGTGNGDVTGPGSSTDSNFALFNATSGTVIKDLGVNSNSFASSVQGDTADSAIQTSSNVGPGAGLAEPKIGTNLAFKSLVAGVGVTVTPGALDIVIAATGGGGGGEVNTSSNVGIGEILALPKVAEDLPFKTLIGGASVTLTPTTNDLIIAVDTADFATGAEGDLAASATQPGNNVSTLTNDADYKSYDSDTVANGFPPAAGYPEGFLFMLYTP